MTQLDDFLDGPKIIGGLQFRPFTIGSKIICQQLNLTLFTTGEVSEEEGEADRQIAAFTWLHCAPLKEVLAAIRNKRADEASLEYAFALNPSSMPEIVLEINRISKQAAKNTVEVDSPESDSDSGN
jgi:hypothetical protein